MLKLIPLTQKEYVSEYKEYAEKYCLIAGFWDNVFTKVNRYCIKNNEKIIGFISLFKPENLLTAFFIRKGCEYYHQRAFDFVKSELAPKGARAMTNDIMFISAALEHASRVNQQAYLFDLTDERVKPASYPRSWFKLASEADTKDLAATNFYDSAVIGDPEN